MAIPPTTEGVGFLANLIMSENEGVRYQYYINTQKLFEKVQLSSKKPVKESEITTGYDIKDDGKLFGPTTKVVREITSRGDTFLDNLKYDFIKTLISYIIEAWDTEDITLKPGMQICLNTLVNDGIVVMSEVNDVENVEEE